MDTASLIQAVRGLRCVGPGLNSGLLTADQLRPSVVANLNGDQFVSDPRPHLMENDCILILSADAGG